MAVNNSGKNRIHENAEARCDCLARRACILIALLVIFVCADYTAAQPNKGRELNIGFSKTLLQGAGISDARTAMKVWMWELAEAYQLNINPGIVILDDESGMESAMDRSCSELVTMSTIEYLGSRRAESFDPVLVLGDKDGNVLQKFVLLERSDRHPLKDMPAARRDIAVGSGYRGDVARLWMESRRRHRPGEEIHFRTLERESRAVLEVFFGQAAACVTTLKTFRAMAALNTQLAEKLQIVDVSPGYLLTITCVPADMRAAIRERIVSGAMELAGLPRGRQILTLLQHERMLPFRPEYLAGVTSLIEERGGRRPYKRSESRRNTNGSMRYAMEERLQR